MGSSEDRAGFIGGPVRELLSAGQRRQSRRLGVCMQGRLWLGLALRLGVVGLTGIGRIQGLEAHAERRRHKT